MKWNEIYCISFYSKGNRAGLCSLSISLSVPNATIHSECKRSTRWSRSRSRRRLATTVFKGEGDGAMESVVKLLWLPARSPLSPFNPLGLGQTMVCPSVCPSVLAIVYSECWQQELRSSIAVPFVLLLWKYNWQLGMGLFTFMTVFFSLSCCCCCFSSF